MPESDRPGFPMTGFGRAGVTEAADSGSARRGNVRDNENAARRGLPIRGEFMGAILTRAYS